MAGYVPFVTQDHLWNTNWKLLTENFMEGYHLPVAHRGRSAPGSRPRRPAFPEQVFDSFTYQTFIKNQDAKYGLAHTDNTVLEGTWRYTSVMPTIYPTHMIVSRRIISGICRCGRRAAGRCMCASARRWRRRCWRACRTRTASSPRPWISSTG